MHINKMKQLKQIKLIDQDIIQSHFKIKYLYL